MSYEEWDTYDDDTSREPESLPEESDEKCPYCQIYKVMAESRLFEVPENFRTLSEGSPHPMSRHQLIYGSSRGCQFCDLLVAVITTWEKEQGIDDKMWNVAWGLDRRDGQFLIILWASSHQNICLSVSIFCGTGFQSQWNLCEHPMCISGDTSSPEAVATARSWLEDCKNKHDSCKRESHPQKAPKRILILDGKQAKLCENPKPAIAYACLSHCWGPRGPAMQLRPNTMADLKAGVPLDTLPKTFRDAAWFCWRLGVNYIWIDALCIIQGDETDWEEAAATMADVYEGAVITIAAAGSDSSEHGCFAPAMHDIALSEGGLYFRDDLDEFPSQGPGYDDRWPLFQRAWVYQERRLSIRVLHIGKQQLFWECNSKLLSENDLEGHEHNFGDSKSREVEKDPEAGWRNIIQHYSKLRLTYEKDRLPAISAIVKRLQRLRQDDVYIAGMWKKTLRRDLCWFPGGDEPLARPNNQGLVIPSWSWVSVSAGVSFQSKPLPSLEVVDVVYNITGPAHIGQVSHASLHLKARFMFVKPDLNVPRPFKTLRRPDGIWSDDEKPMEVFDNRWDFDYTTADPPIHANETFIILAVSTFRTFGHTYFIVLRELANKRFERVGCVFFMPVDYLSDLESEPESGSESEPELEPAWLLELPIGQFTIV